ncbi:hypothetical protein KIN20_038191 [Parelaphostrongylus tenuis]|uniref:Uncharacterized protein n=1 Tax=Parelaphostrongylus tenuis TaxID=148309 RepID=A0AAD5WLE9_PARTN|nr:hypothetical protein KIN20_038190 [Parelaphostrongylus tenuis]KAJ1374974.1 hypothetical protein KIN20_038191 [Parelaphostrongylus tenuis]
MKIFTNVVRYPIGFTMVFLLSTIRIVFGCGVMPAGQARTVTFTVTGFTLPVAMVYTEEPTVSARVPGVATSEAGAKAFVERLVMQTVFDVLESQGRKALLPDAVIATILDQLSVKTSYKPLECQMVASPEETRDEKDAKFCIIVDSTVTGICTTADPQGQATCTATEQGKVTVTSVPSDHLTISGTLSTTNIIMANWSKAIWQSVVNRAIRMLAWGPFGSHFSSASATVN